MIPDALIAIPEPAAQVRVYDAPAAVFFLGFADDVPFTDCWNAADWNEQHETTLALGRWMTEVLSRVVIEPALTTEMLYRLGDVSRAALTRGYFELVGWLPRNPDRVPVPTTVAPRRRKAVPPHFEALTTLPGPNLTEALKTMARRTRTRPATLWLLPTSEFLFNLRVVSDPRPDAKDFLRSLGVDG